jgi:hypothetical protein
MSGVSKKNKIHSLDRLAKKITPSLCPSPIEGEGHREGGYYHSYYILFVSLL